MSADRPHWTPTDAEANECRNCGNTVSPRFTCVFGDNGDVIHACPDCDLPGDEHCCRTELRSRWRPMAAEPWRDKTTLEDLYHGEGLSQSDIGEKLGCDQTTVSVWMDKLDMSTRNHSTAVATAYSPPKMKDSDRGYEMFQVRDNYDIQTVYVHRLLAVAEYGFDNVCGKIVHHKNEIKWDNRPGNIEMMDDSEHKSLHAEHQGEGIEVFQR